MKTKPNIVYILAADTPEQTEAMKRSWDDWFIVMEEEWRSAYRLNTKL
ncbi:MAG: hypothetical protein ACLFSE_10860 [Spirochaetia bacterium]